MQFIDTINPTNGEHLTRHYLMRPESVEQKLSLANQVQRLWSKERFATRADYLHRIANILLERKHECARLITTEMGKIIRDSVKEVEQSAEVFQHYADHGEKYLKPEPIETEFARSYRCYEPLGVIYMIMPWNHPFWQVAKFVSANLIGGNSVVLKHAPNVTGCALKFEQILRDVELPEGLFTVLVIDVDQSPAVIANPNVAGVTLTGSCQAGRSVSVDTAKVLKPISLELGGSDPALILADANLDDAAEKCVAARLRNTGQVCMSPKRLIVVDEVHDLFVEKVLQLVRGYSSGDPQLTSTSIGPIARKDLRRELHKQVVDTIAAGATCLLGGQVPDGPGYFYPPTVLIDIGKGMRAYEEELFGPVISIFRAADEEDAIRIANDTEFGLGASVYTQDLKRGEYIARKRIEAGMAFVNHRIFSDPRLPFGGVKNSGNGRELAKEGVIAFMNTKTIVVDAVD